ncbi:DNA primase [Mycoplasmopsis meleagridis]|uniref:DNA primase n=1 Tax=Mycoplasmopsis meleagridis TaxID=29561 RepID=UPI003A88F809
MNVRLGLYQKILEVSDIVETISEFLSLNKKGRNYNAICPFHSDTSPSLSISPEKQIFKCFSCNTSGNSITFVEKYKKISTTEAMKYLANKHNIDVSLLEEENISYYSEKQQEEISFLERVNNFFKIELIKEQFDTKIYNFLLARKLNKDILDKFDIGFAREKNFEIVFKNDILENDDILYKTSLKNDSDNFTFNNRITFAIRNEHGDVIGFSGRVLDDSKPKYVNSAESSVFQKSRILYNISNALSNDINDELIICEGFFDVIALYKAGIKNAVALMGTALSKNHLSLVKNKSIVLFLDGDEAGINATLKNAYFLHKNGLKVKIVNNESQEDPDEILNARGDEYLRKLVEQASNLLDYLYDFLIKKYNLKTNGSNNFDKVEKFTLELKEYLKYASKNEADFYREKIHKEFNYLLEPFLIENNNSSNSFEIEENIFLENQNPIDLAIENNIDWIDKLFILIIMYPNLKDIFIRDIVSKTSKILFNFNHLKNKEFKEEFFYFIKNSSLDEFNLDRNNFLEFYSDEKSLDFIREVRYVLNKYVDSNKLDNELISLYDQTLQRALELNDKTVNYETVNSISRKIRNQEKKIIGKMFFKKISIQRNSRYERKVNNNAKKK